MQEKIVEIIVYLLEEFQTGEVAPPNYTDLSKELISRGYTENEINLAISWVFDHFQDNTQDTYDNIKYNPQSARVLNEVEKLIISPQAYGYLLQLRQLGLISESELEFVIERAISLGNSTIGVEDMKNIIAALLFSMEDNNHHDGFLFQKGSNTVH
ncbi:MAG: DUF494 family protein [Calditrichaceae bacterium]|nr:DUF494 family protein [Calditrichaceae bacterium]MBN2708333.1 DUF494 family protein [Calditrichaceae bacterium]RQV95222.1 MAG: DUF494 family protein [Calditrichota bacterium]